MRPLRQSTVAHIKLVSCACAESQMVVRPTTASAFGVVMPATQSLPRPGGLSFKAVRSHSSMMSLSINGMPRKARSILRLTKKSSLVCAPSTTLTWLPTLGGRAALLSWRVRVVSVSAASTIRQRKYITKFTSASGKNWTQT